MIKGRICKRILILLSHLNNKFKIRRNVEYTQNKLYKRVHLVKHFTVIKI